MLLEFLLKHNRLRVWKPVSENEFFWKSGFLNAGIMARKAWLEISSFRRVNGRENKLYRVMESWFTLLLISLNRVKHYIYSSKDIRTEGDNFAFLDSCSVFNSICFRIVIFPTMCCLDEVCLDDFTTKIFKCFLKCCVKNKARRRHFSFLLRWIVGFELNLAQFIYVEVEISTAAYQTFSAIVILHIIFLLIIGISFFRSHKILTLGYVFVFKGLSLSMAVLVFNMTTAGFNMLHFRGLFAFATEKGIARAANAVIALFDICVDGLGLLVRVIYILWLFCRTSKSFEDILCLSHGKACCCSGSVEEPEEDIQELSNYIWSICKPDTHKT